MSFGLVSHSNSGSPGLPSPSIWGDCPNTLLNDKGLGFFVSRRFAGDTPTLPGVPTDSDASSTFTYNTGALGNRTLDVTVSGTDNNAASMFSRPLGKIVKDSGNKLWFEADVALAAIADQGVFVGVAELAALDRDVIADAATTVGTESVIGFLCAADDTDAFDAVYRKNADTVVEVLPDATNSQLLDSPGAVAALAFHKFGVYFDGRDRVRFYVDGVNVYTAVLDDTFDQSKEYGAILSVKTGANASRTIHTRFFQAAYQSSN